MGNYQARSVGGGREAGFPVAGSLLNSTEGSTRVSCSRRRSRRDPRKRIVSDRVHGAAPPFSGAGARPASVVRNAEGAGRRKGAQCARPQEGLGQQGGRRAQRTEADQSAPAAGCSTHGVGGSGPPERAPRTRGGNSSARAPLSVGAACTAGPRCASGGGPCARARRCAEGPLCAWG